MLPDLARRAGRPPVSLSPSAEARLALMPLPGNTRELRNVLERALSLTTGQRIEEGDIAPFDADAALDAPDSPAVPSLRESGDEAERVAIRSALDANDWAIQKAADALGISRKNLWEKMRRHGIARDTDEAG